VQGVLLVDKPKGWTSFDVVNYVRKIVATHESKKPKNCKVGHTGTLDPAATGLLVLLVGKEYTRRAQELTKLDKTYQVTMKLGEVSSTGDQEGEIIAYRNGDKITPVKMPSQAEIEQVTNGFLGTSLQIPPQFSAIKISGRKAYDLARKGEKVELEPRPVKVYKIAIKNYSYPYIELEVAVSSGTYIRSLVQDIGQNLGTGAYMSDLRRTEVGAYRLDDATDIKALTAGFMEEHLRVLNI